jgi:hypothetical protein
VGYEAKSQQRMTFVFVGQNKTEGNNARKKVYENHQDGIVDVAKLETK